MTNAKPGFHSQLHLQRKKHTKTRNDPESLNVHSTQCARPYIHDRFSCSHDHYTEARAWDMSKELFAIHTGKLFWDRSRFELESYVCAAFIGAPPAAVMCRCSPADRTCVQTAYSRLFIATIILPRSRERSHAPPCGGSELRSSLSVVRKESGAQRVQFGQQTRPAAVREMRGLRRIVLYRSPVADVHAG